MSNDLISREALKEDLAKEIKTNDMGLWLKLLLVIDNAPAVEEVSVIEFKEPLPLVKAQKIVKTLSKKPQGEWIFKNGKYRCTACGEKAIYRYSGSLAVTQTELLTDFCPNCGADMRKGGS